MYVPRQDRKVVHGTVYIRGGWDVADIGNLLRKAFVTSAPDLYDPDGDNNPNPIPWHQFMGSMVIDAFETDNLNQLVWRKLDINYENENDFCNYIVSRATQAAGKFVNTITIKVYSQIDSEIPEPTNMRGYNRGFWSMTGQIETWPDSSCMGGHVTSSSSHPILETKFIEAAWKYVWGKDLVADGVPNRDTDGKRSVWIPGQRGSKKYGMFPEQSSLTMGQANSNDRMFLEYNPVGGVWGGAFTNVGWAPGDSYSRYPFSSIPVTGQMVWAVFSNTLSGYDPDKLSVVDTAPGDSGLFAECGTIQADGVTYIGFCNDYFKLRDILYAAGQSTSFTSVVQLHPIEYRMGTNRRAIYMKPACVDTIVFDKFDTNEYEIEAICETARGRERLVFVPDPGTGNMYASGRYPVNYFLPPASGARRYNLQNKVRLYMRRKNTNLISDISKRYIRFKHNLQGTPLKTEIVS